MLPIAQFQCLSVRRRRRQESSQCHDPRTLLGCQLNRTKNQISGSVRLEKQLGRPEGQHEGADAANWGIDNAAEERLSAKRRLKFAWAEATFGRELLRNIGERCGLEARVALDQQSR